MDVDARLHTDAEDVWGLGDPRGGPMFSHTARDAGHTVAVGRQEFTGVAKAKAMGQTSGFIQFVADPDTDRVLGCHIVGPDAGNLVHEAVIAMVADAPYRDIGRAIHIHPTLAEGVNSAAGGVHRPPSD